jgi:hypothetical protein
LPAIVFATRDLRRNILFAHIPKSGGSALVDYFRGLGAHVLLHNEVNPIGQLLKCPIQHFHYELLDTIYRLERFHFSFAIVRNPIERSKSDYLWGHRRHPDPGRMPTFDQHFDLAMTRYQRDPYTFDNHLRPQHQFLGPMIRTFYRYEQGLDAIARDVLAKIGVSLESGPVHVPRKNSAEQLFGEGIKSSDVAMSDSTLKRLKDFYRVDLEMFYPELL